MAEASTTFDKSPKVQALKQHYETVTKQAHLRDLLQDEQRNAALRFKVDDSVWLDYTHTKIDLAGLALLADVAREQGVARGVQDMFAGEVVNPTEGRKVWHVKLRAEDQEEVVAV